MTPDKELAYQARIRELREALAEVREVWAGSEAGEPVHAQEAYAIRLCKQQYQIAVEALSRPDDLSSLEAYVREGKRKVLREVAVIIRADKCSGESGYAISVNDATEKHADAIEQIAGGLK